MIESLRYIVFCWYSLRFKSSFQKISVIKMCGICVCGTVSSVAKNTCCSGLLKDSLLLVKNRGPDGFSQSYTKLLNWEFQFCGSILWMQGKYPMMQPVMDDDGNILLWNGDIFDGPLVPDKDKCDTAVVSEAFKNSLSDELFLNVLSTIKGPYSFVYWNVSTKKMWFGRDRIGRHSLLYHFCEGQFILTSVGKKGIPFLEVPVSGIYMLDFSKDSYHLTVFPWSDVTVNDLTFSDLHIPVHITQSLISSPVNIECPLPYEPSEEYLSIIEESLDGKTVVYDQLLSNNKMSCIVGKVLECLRKAVMMRTNIQCKMCRKCVVESFLSKSVTPNYIECKHPQVGILFSGGVDSTTLAALAHEFIPAHIPIDLFNVAFETGRLPCVGKFTVPDRKTGILSYNELKETFPDREWNFVEINVPKDELEEFRRTRINDLIHPLESVLDDSLGCALWFASRLNGILNGKNYESPARVLLLGMGADEQFGGYMRHRTILRRQGWEALAFEMKLELQRIASRNLGRDDRIVADHGCQARFPFLDEDLINCISSIPVWARAYPTLLGPPGVGDKLLLRLVAWKLGLKKAALIPKRAFQFGSRIADSKERASDISPRLK